MTVVALSPYRVADFPAGGGGHFWAFMQYALGLRGIGCDVLWLERLTHKGARWSEPERHAALLRRLEPFGLAEHALVYTTERGRLEWIGRDEAAARRALRRAEALVNFDHLIDDTLRLGFQRTAFVDIDPGLRQIWIADGAMGLPEHGAYLTIGETVGTAAARFPDAGLPWVHIRPPVCLAAWPPARRPARRGFSTVSSWYGGQWVGEREDGYENNKRVSFLEFARLPIAAGTECEIASYFSDADGDDRHAMEVGGWTLRHVLDVASGPSDYHAYVQGSRGELSCAKPSCMRLQNGWISDRTVCYLASGRPAVVQYTGPSAALDGGAGVLRFSTIDEAVAALAEVEAHYAHHSRAARELAEEHFDARLVAERVLAAC